MSDSSVQSAIQQSVEAFRRDLPRLLEECPGRWIAYHAATQVGTADTKSRLLQACYQRGYRDEELFVANVQPDFPTAFATWPTS